jgi:hypothetical protein
MIEPNEQFLENSGLLQDRGAIVSSEASGSWLRIENVQRDLGVLLARALHERLEQGDEAEYSGGRFDFMLSHDLGDAIERSAKKRSTLVETRPAGRKFAVRLEQNTGGLISLVADVRNEYEDNPELGGRAILQAGYLAVMNELKLAPAPKDELEESVEDVLEELDVEVRGSSRTADEVKSHRESDIREAPKTLRLLGIKDADNVRLLRELWADRSLDKVAIIDLFLHLVDEKQGMIGNNHPEYYPEMTLEDLVDTGQHLPAADLRGAQQLKSTKLFKDLGFDAKDIERRFLNADKQRALGFRYAAWLIEQPFMGDSKRKIKADLAGGANIPSIRLFTRMTNDLKNAYKTHKDNDDGKYNLAIGWQADEHRKKLEFLKTCLVLCLDIFLDQDVSRFVEDR